MDRSRVIVALTTLLVGGAVLLWWFGGDRRSTTSRAAGGEPRVAAGTDSAASNDQSIETSSADDQDPAQEQRQLLVGAWQDDFYGKRTFVFNADGTGSMTLELSGVGKTLYGDKLRFEMQWTLSEGVVTKIMSGGEPKTATALLAKTFGDRAAHRIDHLDDTELHFRSVDSDKVYRLNRVVLK